MYTSHNFKTKKALKEAVARYNNFQEDGVEVRYEPHEPVTIYQPGGMFNPPEASPDYTGRAFLEGPHYPAPHTWYAQVELKDGIVIKVR